MLKRKQNTNEGFTLVEVIVSMLVLSIVIVSVLTAFTTSTKNNNSSKKAQSAESLLENIVEFTEKSDASLTAFYDDAVQGTKVDVTSTNSYYEYTNVKQGFYTYKVKITTETNPDAYKDGLNAFEAINLGSNQNRSILVDVSEKGCDTNGNGVNDYDELALSTFYSMHTGAMSSLKVLFPSIVLPADENSIKDNISREFILHAKKTGAGNDKMYIRCYLRYIFDYNAITCSEDINGDGVQNSSDKMLMISDLNGDGSVDEKDWVIEYEVVVSPNFDLPSAAGVVTKLENVYVLFSHSSLFTNNEENEIRIYDQDTVLGSNVFLAYQEETKKTLDDAVAIKNLNTRFNSTENVHVKFSSPSSDITVEPYNVNLYCSVKINTPVVIASVNKHDYQLVAANTETRIEEITIEVMDSASGSLLSSAKVLRLK